MTDKFQMPQGVRVICAFPGVGKSKLSEQNISFVDLDFPQLKDDLPRYLKAVTDALKIPGVTVMLPTWPQLRAALYAAEIPYVLFYPSRDLKADYQKRYRGRGDELHRQEVMYSMWEAFVHSCETDPTPYKVEMRQSQARLADYFL